VRIQLLLLSLVSLLITTGAALSADGPKNGTVLIIRHAEDSASGPGLSPDGEKRAGALPQFFREYQIEDKPVHIDLIYAAADSEKSQRPKLTVEPLASELKIKVNDEFDTKQLKALTKRLENIRANETVLICWRHGEMEELVRELGGKSKELLADGKWPEHVYDWVLELHYDRKGKLTQAKRVSQHLLPSDGH
jgi:hypothetical protein